jgi:bacterioferritin-associated ferredoxin
MIMEEDKLICTCMDVYKSTIVKAIKEKGLKTVEEVGEETTAGTVCGQCQDDIQEILDEINGK